MLKRTIVIAFAVLVFYGAVAIGTTKEDPLRISLRPKVALAGMYGATTCVTVLVTRSDERRTLLVWWQFPYGSRDAGGSFTRQLDEASPLQPEPERCIRGIQQGTSLFVAQIINKKGDRVHYASTTLEVR